MVVVIAASNNSVKTVIDPHFGRCHWYCLFNSVTKKTEFIENTSRNMNERAGCESAEILIKKGINIAIAGRFGSKVVEAFRSNNVQMIVPEKQKTITEILNQIK